MVLKEVKITLDRISHGKPIIFQNIKRQQEQPHGQSKNYSLPPSVWRPDLAETLAPANDIDPAYGQELRHAVKSGGEVLACDVGIDLEKIVLNRRIPLRL